MKKNTNCKLCGSFKTCEDYTYACLCDECDLKAFNMIKEYLYENGASDETSIHNYTKLPHSVIRGYIAHNRLEEIFKLLNKTFYKCQKCGSLIVAPGLCNVCRGLNQEKDHTDNNNKIEPTWHSRRR